MPIPGTRAPMPACAHPATVADILTSGRLAAVLADDAQFEGATRPGRDYRAEAAELAPILLLLMQSITPAEITDGQDEAA